MKKQEVIINATSELAQFLEENFTGKRISFSGKISTTTNGQKIIFEKVSPSIPGKKLASSSRKKVTKASHLEILCTETFDSIRKAENRAMGRELIKHIAASKTHSISAGEIIDLFKKHKVSLYGPYGFSTELQSVNRVLLTRYGCSIIREDAGDFSTDLERTFALYNKTKKRKKTKRT